jgi:ATP-binding cassette subfamily G (WHITE) protein 2 (SNQ2)
LASREFVFSSAPFEEIADAMLNSFFKAKDSIQGTQNKLFVRMSTLGTAAVLMDFSE